MRLSENDVLVEVTEVTLTRLRVWVREGWVVPQRDSEGQPAYDATDVARLRLLCHLEDELDLGDEAMPVVLSLLDQVYGLRRELKALARAVDNQPHEVRQALLATYRSHVEE